MQNCFQIRSDFLLLHFFCEVSLLLLLLGTLWYIATCTIPALIISIHQSIHPLTHPFIHASNPPRSFPFAAHFGLFHKYKHVSTRSLCSKFHEWHGAFIINIIIIISHSKGWIRIVVGCCGR